MWIRWLCDVLASVRDNIELEIIMPLKKKIKKLIKGENSK